MADIKKRTLILSTGKLLRLFGTSIGIGKTLEIGECYAPNIFSNGITSSDDKPPGVSNPFLLTSEEIMEIADFNIRLWVDLKDNIRKHGINNPKIFIKEAF